MTNVLNRFGLSYWQLTDELKLDKDGNLTLEGVLDLRDRIERRYWVFQTNMDNLTEDALREDNARVDENSTVDGWRQFYIKRSIALITFLDRAIKSGSGIRWSV